MGLRQNLSRRELEVSGLIVAEKSTSEIAQELHVSEQTVYTHIDRICEKTRCESKSQLVSALLAWIS